MNRAISEMSIRLWTVVALTFLMFGKNSNGQTTTQDNQGGRAQQLLQLENAKKARILRWQATLSTIAKREHATMFVDLKLAGDPPNVTYSKPAGRSAMVALASATASKWNQITGMQVFKRDSDDADGTLVSTCLNWINTLPEEAFRRLCDGSTKLTDLDDQSREMMLKFAGWQPDVSFALVGNDDAIQVQVIVAPKLTFKDPKTGASRELNLGPQPRRPYSKKPLEPADGVPLEKNSGGELKFGDGVILTLKEILDRSHSVFGVRYQVDARIEANNYFVSGSYDRGSFETAVEVATTVPPVSKRSNSNDLKSNLALLKFRLQQAGPDKLDFMELRKGIRISGSKDLDAINQKYGSQEQMNTSQFLNSATMSAGALMQNMPGLTNFLQSQGMSSDTMVTLDMDFVIAVGTAGEHVMSNAYFQSSADGAQPAYGENETLAVLK